MIEITRPLMTLVDASGHPIPGVSKSTSEVEAMEKASRLGPGVYGLIRPEATITVTADVTADDVAVITSASLTIG